MHSCSGYSTAKKRKRGVSPSIIRSGHRTIRSVCHSVRGQSPRLPCSHAGHVSPDVDKIYCSHLCSENPERIPFLRRQLATLIMHPETTLHLRIQHLRWKIAGASKGMNYMPPGRMRPLECTRAESRQGFVWIGESAFLRECTIIITAVAACAYEEYPTSCDRVRDNPWKPPVATEACANTAGRDGLAPPRAPTWNGRCLGRHRRCISFPNLAHE